MKGAAFVPRWHKSGHGGAGLLASGGRVAANASAANMVPGAPSGTRHPPSTPRGVLGAVPSARGPRGPLELIASPCSNAQHSASVKASLGVRQRVDPALADKGTGIGAVPSSRGPRGPLDLIASPCSNAQHTASLKASPGVRQRVAPALEDKGTGMRLDERIWWRLLSAGLNVIEARALESCCEMVAAAGAWGAVRRDAFDASSAVAGARAKTCHVAQSSRC